MALGGTVGTLRSQHRMVGKTYADAAAPADLHRFELSDTQVRTFGQQGFLGPFSLLNGQQVETLRNGLERMLEPDYPRARDLIGHPKLPPGGPGARRGVIYFQGPWMAEEAFHDLVFTPKLTVPLCQLLGVDTVRFFHDQVFYKPPHHGGIVAWHQDYSYWTRTRPPGHITCFIALDDSTLENGCLHLVPGSHRWNLLPRVRLTSGSSEDMDSIKSVLTPEQRAQFHPVPMVLKAGEASFHHCFTVHGSYANNSPRPRRSLVLNYMRSDTLSDSDQPLMPGAPVIPPGQVVEGEMFPLAGGRSSGPSA
jgi:hypothetical protein